ncbi:1-(5-phosphoribosyl)-5-[(5-phosphoribosylamino)methylideneamino] imidazole-4-carboxamide isomerase [Candidatus Tremblaya princeps]|uniref:1-(5-phosphoribosyl)-5-[(5-phosphoribosylamino)methylideneamino] imidazole-4-carboxamide isomerase n=1 Tax=Tremblaya princeps TaxID=189385 RepID=A0A143WRQ1_TREPR|nr:1-(5-phosphoribosyl)-5-[(5-phosphoribosylamino)methylideneamino] imidazole-4-carboxamide isomerase [Candidatus Tremblaya princeps]
MCQLLEMATVGILLPAIDVRRGYCARLLNVSPTMQSVVRTAFREAERLALQRARRVHIVDLDGAMGSTRSAVARLLCRRFYATCSAAQVGGCARTISAVEHYLSCGAACVVLGTTAVLRPSFLLSACAEFPGRIALAEDVRHGESLTHGWLRLGGVPFRRASLLQNHGGQFCTAITDATSDGTMQGIMAQAGAFHAGATPAVIGRGAFVRGGTGRASPCRARTGIRCNMRSRSLLWAHAALAAQCMRQRQAHGGIGRSAY